MLVESWINFDGTGAELYDMEIDRKETTNLVSTNPKEAESYVKTLRSKKKWIEDYKTWKEIR